MILVAIILFMGFGILSGEAIHAAVRNGKIKISPFNPEQVNPASYDLTLGEHCVVYTGLELDAAKENPTESFKLPKEGYLLQPGKGYLLHTRERICTNHYVPVVDGKSSIGRLFVWIHVTAGYGDPGFDGQYTLEVVVVYPTMIYPGMRIGQIRFHTLVGRRTNYKNHQSNYLGILAEGPVPSRSWIQFRDKK